MSAPEKLPGEVWRGTIGPATVAVSIADRGTSRECAWAHEWTATRSFPAERWRAPITYSSLEVFQAWALAMMAERDAAAAEVARLTPSKPSLPGYGHDAEPPGLWRVAWRKKNGGRMGYGETETFDIVSAACAALNRMHPDAHHWPEAVEEVRER